jgi:hypothetical protein
LLIPQARKRRGRAIAAFVGVACLIAIAASGCSSSPATTVPRAQGCETQKAATLRASYVNYWGRDPGISWARFAREFPAAVRPPTSQADLVGPHSSLLLGGEATVTAVDGAQACALGLPRPQRAAAGHQLLLVLDVLNNAGGPDPGLPECQSGNPPAACNNYDEPTIVIGGHSTGLPLVVGAGNVLVVSVPDGAPAELQMNDGGRAQDIDLRTGLRTSEASSLYYPVPQQTLNPNLTWSWNIPNIPALKWWAGEGSGPALSDADLTVGNGTALLAPYVDSPGWAPPGQAWLLMSFQLALQTPGNIVLNVPSSFTLMLPDGATVPASGTATNNSGSSDQGTASLTFEVPDTTRTATLKIQPTVQQWDNCNGCGNVQVAQVPPAQPDSSDTAAIQLGG